MSWSCPYCDEEVKEKYSLCDTCEEKETIARNKQFARNGWVSRRNKPLEKPTGLIKYTIKDLINARGTNSELYLIIKEWLKKSKEELREQEKKNLLNKEIRIKDHLDICHVVRCKRKKTEGFERCAFHFKQRREYQRKENLAKKELLEEINKKNIKVLKVETFDTRGYKMELQKVNEVPSSMYKGNVTGELTRGLVEQLKHFSKGDVFKVPISQNYPKEQRKKVCNKYVCALQSAGKYANKTVKVNERTGDVYVTIVEDYYIPKPKKVK